MTTEGEYDFDGKLLLLPFKGHGHGVAKMCKSSFLPKSREKFDIVISVDVEMIHKIRFQSEKRKGGVPYTSIRSYELSMEPKSIVFRFDNLFDGKNPELSDTLHTVMNENWRDLYEDVRSQYEDDFAFIFKSYGNRIFSKVPLNKIFPE